MRENRIPPSDEAAEGFAADPDQLDGFNRLGVAFCEQLVGPLPVFEEEMEHRITVQNESGDTRSCIYEAWDVEDARLDALSRAIRDTGDGTWVTATIESSPYDDRFEREEDSD
ncbi:MAG: hypothetical protein M3N29_00820 [Chloroflexota bacterium]|nr:hypothetical protein [Chloroflexota bacterium]